MGIHEHKATTTAKRVRVAVLTASDTRTEANDEGGRTIREKLAAAGHEVVHHAILREDPELLRAELTRLVQGQTVQTIVTTGGTGIGARDSTYEVVAAMLEKVLDGFGELFRYLSYEQVGSAAMLSRAIGGTVGGVVVLALPGSVSAVELGMDRLILPELGHMVKIAERASGRAS